MIARRRLVALTALLLGLALLIGLVYWFVALRDRNPSVPSDAVALVEGDPISKESYQRRFRYLASSPDPQTGLTGSELDPPRFERCIEDMRSALDADDLSDIPDYTFRTQCRNRYETVKADAMRSLIEAKWYALQAQKFGVTVSTPAAEALAARQVRQNFSSPEKFQRFVEKTQLTKVDFVQAAREVLIANAVGNKLSQGNQEPEDKDVESAIERQRRAFVSPESRDVEVVVTTDRSSAEKALAAIRSGMTMQRAGAQFTTDATVRSNGGVLAGISRASSDAALAGVVFRSKPGRINGPFQVRDSWYIIKIRSIKKAEKPSKKELEKRARAYLRANAGQIAATRLVLKAQEAWRKETFCQKGYIVPQCANSPLGDLPKPPPGSSPTEQQNYAPPYSLPTPGDGGQGAQGAGGGSPALPQGSSPQVQIPNP